MTLEPMSQPRFDRYMAVSPEEFAHETASAWKRPVAETRAQASTEFPALLPQGLATPGHRLFDVRIDDAVAGMAWLKIDEKPGGTEVYIYDLRLDESWRGQGHGRALLAMLEAKARELGGVRLSLSVFGDNTVARALYESAGFETGRIAMFKLL